MKNVLTLRKSKLIENIEWKEIRIQDNISYCRMRSVHVVCCHSEEIVHGVVDLWCWWRGFRIIFPERRQWVNRSRTPSPLPQQRPWPWSSTATRRGAEGIVAIHHCCSRWCERARTWSRENIHLRFPTHLILVLADGNLRQWGCPPLSRAGNNRREMWVYRMYDSVEAVDEPRVRGCTWAWELLLRTHLLSGSR